MDNEFVPYVEALELNELGFDEVCFTYYKNDQLSDFLEFNKNSEIVNVNNEVDDYISAPTFSQAFRFFREKYSIRHSIMDFIDDEIGIEWDYEIATIGTDLDENGHYEALIGYSIDDENRKFITYEEAQIDCLRKLIKLVKL